MMPKRLEILVAAMVLASASLVYAQNYAPINVNLDVDQARLDEIMEKRIALNHEDQRFSEVVEELANQIDMPIFLDEKALMESGITTDMPVSIHALSVRVEAALSLLLDQQDMTWTPKHGGLVFTTQDAAASQPITRVYPVYDLVMMKWRGKTSFDYDTLIEVLTSSIDTDSWEENGGNGTVEPFNGSLVISQTWVVHRKLERTFTALRAARGVAPTNWSNAAPPIVSVPRRPRQPRQTGFMFPGQASTQNR